MTSTRHSIMACMLVLACIMLGATSLRADTPKRYALVIGNSAYQNADVLPNAAGDAAQIAQRLSELSFQVFAGFNVDRLSFQRLVTQFSEQAGNAEAEAVVIYYAGHGFQLDGLNHLVPVDASLRDASTLAAETFKLDDIIASVHSPDRQTIVFLDACRDTPVAAILPNAGESRGLAQMNTGDNTFVAFATQPGNVSLDGSSRNSPFAEALLAQIAKPQLSLSDLMIAVRNDVANRTLGRQVPWNQSSLRSQFYFNQDRSYRVADSTGAGNSDSATPMIVLGAAPGAQQASVTRSGSGQAMQLAALDPQAGKSVEVAGAEEAGSADVAPTGEAEDASQPSETAAEPSDASQPAPEETRTAALASDAKTEPAEPTGDELIRPLQAKLREVGCYRGAVDGDWGPMSRSAVKQYYQAKGRSVPSLEPTVDLLNRLERDSKRVCAPPTRTATVKKQRPAARQHPPARQQQARRPYTPPPPPPHLEPHHGPSPTFVIRPGGGFGVGFGY